MMQFLAGLVLGALVLFFGQLYRDAVREDAHPSAYMMNEISQKLNSIEEQQRQCCDDWRAQ